MRKLINYALIVSGDMSANIISNSINLDFVHLISVQCVWTGSPNGILKLQSSNDNIIWSDVTPSLLTINGSGNVLFNLAEIGYSWLRVYFTFNSGSGTLGTVVNGKGD